MHMQRDVCHTIGLEIVYKEFNRQRALQSASPTAIEPYKPDGEGERSAQQPLSFTDSELYGQQVPTANPTARPAALVLLLLLFR